MHTEPRRIDRALVITSLVIALIFLIPKLFQHAAAHTGDMDTGNYSNLAWAIGHGEGFSGSVTGRHHLGEHFSPIMIFIAPIYWIWPSAYVLMILQALAAAGTIVGVLHLADREMRGRKKSSPSRFSSRFSSPRLASLGVPGEGPDDEGGASARTRAMASAMLILMFLLYPPFLAAWRTQFQPIVLGMPLVVIAILLMHARRGWSLLAVAALILMTRESASLCVIGLGIYAMLGLRQRDVGLLLIMVGWISVPVTTAAIMPHFRGGNPWPHTRWIGPGAMWDLKALYLATMLVSFGPLPYLNRQARAAAAGAVPGMILNLLVARETQVTFIGHYDAQTAPFMMIAAAHGAASLVRAPDAWWKRATLASPLLTITFFGIANAKTPFQLMQDWWPSETRLALVDEARDTARKYAAAPALSAWANLGPQVCHRPRYIGMRSGTSDASFNEWANARLISGTILLVPTESYPDREATLARKLISSSGRAELVHRGKLVEAWEWRGEGPATEATTRRRKKK